MKMVAFIITMLFYTTTINAQKSHIKYTFFDFKSDSLKSRQTQLSVPTQGQTAGISNSLIIDYIGNSRISITTAIIASKNDTLLAIHSLFNGIGNFTCEIESPIICLPFHNTNFNYIGLSLNPRASTLLNTGNMFQKSTLNADIGINTILKVQGDLGNLSAKLILRNAITFGNNQFIEKLHKINTNAYYYCSFQIKLKANNNVFVINAPLILLPFQAPEIYGLPVYAGFGFSF